MPIDTLQRVEVLVKGEGGWAVDARLRAESLTRPAWPGIPTAEFSLVLADVGTLEPLRMEDGVGRLAYGQEVMIREWAEGGDGAILFWGTVTGKTLAWGEAESARYVAKHVGASLQEHFILGAWGRAYSDFDGSGDPIAGQTTHFDGWPPVVNPGGKGNCSVAGYYDGETELCRLFSPTDSPLSTSWTTTKVLAYVFEFAVVEDAADDLTFPDLSALGESDLVATPRDMDLEGKSWWEAIGLALDFEGWRCRLDSGGSGTSPEAVLAIWELGTGTERTVRLGAAGSAATDQDNAEQGILNLDCSGTVTVPKVWGGPLVLEGTWPLVPGWLAADLDADARPDPDLDPDASENAGVWSETYYARYVADKRAADFASYQDVARKWILNEAGDYGETYGSPAMFDFSAAYASGTWGRRRRRFLECLSWDGLKCRAPVRVEVTYDGGSTWQAFGGSVEVLGDECGVRISDADLAAVLQEADGPDTYWDALCDDKADETALCRLRVTASVADDSAVRPDPALEIPETSPLDRTVEWPYDRRSRYGRRVRMTTGSYASQWASDYAAADTTDDASALSAEAGRIQDVAAMAQVRGSIVLRNTTYAFDPGDVVTEIAGRDISLQQTAAGGTAVYAEVVQVTQVWGDGVYTTEIVLEDARLTIVR